MKIAITGSSGFIGRNFLISCPKDWHIDAFYNSTYDFPIFLREHCPNAIPIRCDLSNEGKVNRLRDFDYDLCLYLAGNTDPQFSFTEPLIDLKSNQLALVNFLSHFCADRFIYLSSGAVYDGLTGPVSPKSKLDPKLPYAISKLASEQYVKFFKEKGNIGGYIIVRFFGAYGPYEHQRKITTKLVRQFAIEKKSEFEIYGNGKNIIDFMYISDFVIAIHQMIRSGKKDITLDLACKKPVSVENIVRRAAKEFGLKPKITKNGVSHEAIRFRSTDKTTEKLGFSPKVKFEQGIQMLAYHLLKSESCSQPTTSKN